MDTEVRVLVVGKSGSGKLPLIRQFMGDETSSSGGIIIRHAPRSEKLPPIWQLMGDKTSSSGGTIIRHARQDLPLIIYENSGVDDATSDRLMVAIKELLDGRLAEIDFCGEEGVQAISYIFSPTDDHVVDDGGLLNNLVSLGKKLPLLLVMTHDDDTMKDKSTRKEEELVVDELLGSISDSERRETLKASMVRVGKNEDVIWDEEGLRLLCGRTKAFMNKKEQWNTWAFITADMCQRRGKHRMRVLVLGEEREEVEEFLRAATNSDGRNGEANVSAYVRRRHVKAKRKRDRAVAVARNDATLPRYSRKEVLVTIPQEIKAAEDILFPLWSETASPLKLRRERFESFTKRQAEGPQHNSI